MYSFAVKCLDPFLLLFAATGLASCYLWRHRRETRRRLLLLNIPLVLLAVICTPAFAYLATGSLEWRYLSRPSQPDSAPAIVVLGGLLKPGNDNDPRLRLGDNTRLRCLTAAELYHRAPCRILVSGGKVDPAAPGPTLAEAMRDQLAGLGVPRTVLLLEMQSRSTHENAVESATMLKAKGIDRVILVTDGTHLLRAERCFQAQGITVHPVASRYRADQMRWSIISFLPSAGAASDVGRVVHEWLGMFWYRIKGRI